MRYVGCFLKANLRSRRNCSRSSKVLGRSLERDSEENSVIAMDSHDIAQRVPARSKVSPLYNSSSTDSLIFLSPRLFFPDYPCPDCDGLELSRSFSHCS